MQELHLVGFTTDRRGLIFRPSDGSSADGFVVPVDNELLAALAGLEPVDADEIPLDDESGTESSPVERAESRLPVREIQGRLRTGETVARVAEAAGVDEAWVERFAPPVRAEQRQVVEDALALHVERPRAGESALPLRRAVATEIAAKGIAFTVPAFEAAWSSRLIGEDRWIIEFGYAHRGHERTASWELDARTKTLTPHDRLGAQLGFIGEDAHVPTRAGLAVDGIVGDLTATPRVADDEPTPRAAKKRPAKKKAAKKKAPAKKRPAKKKAAKKKVPAKKRPAKKKAAKKKVPAKKRPAKKKAAKKKAPAKKRPAKKKAAKKKAPAKKKVPAKKKAAPAKSPAEKAPVGTRKPIPEPATRTTPAEAEGPADDQPTTARSTGSTPPPEAAERPETQPDPSDASPSVDRLGPGQTSEPEPPAPRAEGDTARRRGVVVRSRRPDERSGSDRDSARRARAVERSGSTVQFRSGAAAPVSTAPALPTGDPADDGGDTSAPRPGDADTDATAGADDVEDAPQVRANGAARPRRPRRRQLRAQ